MDASDVAVRVLNRLKRSLGHKSEHPLDRFAMRPAQIPPEERGASELHTMFYENEGPLVHKWRHYLAIYDRHLARFRGRPGPPLRLLELGVSQGGSLALWRKYFGPSATIFGVDVDSRCAAFDCRDARVRIGSQTDRAFLTSVVHEMGGVDVVIDDASHICSHQRKSLETLLPLLASDGVYICEDVHSSYWPGTHEGGYRRASSFIETAKQLVDDLHADFHAHGERVLRASRSIQAVHFYNGMVVIEKLPQNAPAHIRVGTPQF